MANDISVAIQCDTSQMTRALRKVLSFELVWSENVRQRRARIDAMARDAAHVVFGNITADVEFIA